MDSVKHRGAAIRQAHAGNSAGTLRTAWQWFVGRCAMFRVLGAQRVVFGGVLPALLALAVAATACGPAASPGSGSSGPTGAAPKMDVTSAKFSDEWLDPATAAEPPVTQAGGIAPADLTATPKYGGRLTVAHAGTTRLDPHFQLTAASGWVHRTYGSGLLRWDLKTGTPQPDLAESWTVAKDAMSYDFKIRKGVKFHDRPPVNGREVTVQDIKWSMDRMSGLEASPGKQGIFFRRYENVKEFQIIDDATLRMVMKQPDVQILAEIMHDYMLIMPKEAMIDNSFEQAKTLIGTGPFIVEYAEGSGQVRLQRNPTYWEKDKAGRQLPYLDTITVVGISEAAANLAAFKAGQVDMAKLGYAFAKSLFGTPGMRFYNGRGMVNGAIGVVMNVNIPPFNDVRVRRAVNLAIDREEFIEAAMGGHDAAYVIGPIGAWYVWQWDEDKLLTLPGYGRGEAKAKEQAEAKRLLAEAGYPNGIPSLKMYMAGGIQFEVLQKQLAEVGIGIKLESSDQLAIRYATFMKDKQIAWSGQGGGHTPDYALTVYYLCTSVQNMSNYCNPEVDKLFLEQRRERDTAKRKQLFDKIQQILWDDMSLAPVARNANVQMAQPHVRGWRNWWYDSGWSQGYETAWIWLDK